MKQSNLPRKINKSRQGAANEIFLNNLLRRKRGVRNTRTVARKYLRFIKILIPIVLVGAAVYFIYSYLDKKELLIVRNFEVLGAVRFVNQNDIDNLVKTNILNKKITEIDLKSLETLLKDNFLGAKNISVQREGLNKIKVLVEERVPLAVLLSTVDQKKYLIDGEGYVLGEVSEQFNELPVVRYDREILIGTFVEKDLVPLTIELLSLSEKEELNVSSISFKPKYMRLYVENGVEILIGNYKDLAKFMEVASSLIKKASLEGKKLSRIDLRYDKVIVSY